MGLELAPERLWGIYHLERMLQQLSVDSSEREQNTLKSQNRDLI